MLSHTTSGGGRRSPVAILIAPLVAAIVLTLFAWPNARLEPRDLPVGVAGSPAAADAIEQRLAADDGAFSIHRFRDEAAARRAIEDREVYGAFVATAGGPKLLTASAASPMVAQLLTHTASEGGGAALPVEDVVTASPRGSALGSSVLPLVLAGIITGILGSMVASGAAARAGLIGAGSLLAGLTAAAIIHGWLDVVEGHWAATAAALSLAVLAVASVVAGVKSLLGEGAAILAALTMILIGNPFSAVGTAPELLPRPAGGLGQLMPPGAGGNLLRSTGFFDGAAAGGHVAVLAAWAVAGLVLLFAASARERRLERRVAAAVPV
jgi:hypothetical protein